MAVSDWARAFCDEIRDTTESTATVTAVRSSHGSCIAVSCFTVNLAWQVSARFEPPLRGQNGSPLDMLLIRIFILLKFFSLSPAWMCGRLIVLRSRTMQGASQTLGHSVSGGVVGGNN
jgi:hypothetical protein